MRIARVEGLCGLVDGYITHPTCAEKVMIIYELPVKQKGQFHGVVVKLGKQSKSRERAAVRAAQILPSRVRSI
jgi:hypothetical protein